MEPNFNEPTLEGAITKEVIHTHVKLATDIIPFEDWETKIWEQVQGMNILYPVHTELTDLKQMFDECLIPIKESYEAIHGESIEKQLQQDFIKEKVKSTYALAKYISKKYDIITVGEKVHEMFVYHNGRYVQAENEIIYPEIQRILGEYTTKNAKNETFDKLADMTAHPRSIFESAPLTLIPLANGVYDLEAKKLLPHDSKYRFTYQFPVQYDANAKCPKTEEFMKQVLTEDQYSTVLEWMGYYFYRLYCFKKAIIFVGEGDTGKTTLLEVIIHLLGKQNISGISLHKMASDKFAAASLNGKHGNIVDELEKSDVTGTGNFKVATGGGSISAEHKYGNQFSFNNFSKLTFACNRIPDVTDFDDEAYFNRWMVIRFSKTIAKKIPNFIATLTTEEERSGLFNLAMLGLERLLAKGGFSYGMSAVDTKIEMMRSGSSMATFVTDMLEKEPRYEVTKADMYEAYTDFCSDRGLPAETMDMFGKKFLFYVGYATEGQMYDPEHPKGARVRGWRNVKVKASPELQEQIDEFNGE
jgi:P4 family phage/plasmid primase-like protien